MENSQNHVQGPENLYAKQLESLSPPEEKLEKALSMMRDLIGKKENLPFKEFWEVRKLCLPLFKENIGREVRNKFWNEYVELTREGRELKTLLDQEASFACEQIEIAIIALEKEISFFETNRSEALEKNNAFSFESKALEKRFSFYSDSQKALNLLNAYAQRINSLRKELVNTSMRFRFKNKFFESLSHLGDKVFPIRRDLIRDVSQAFTEDVSEFVNAHFSENNFSYEKVKRQVFFFRDEIKALQAFAKVLTLNTQAFTSTREELSKCWDKLKGMEKDIKKEYAEQKLQSQENLKPLLAEIEGLKEEIQKNEDPNKLPLLLERADEIVKKMRMSDLTKSDFNMLKEMLHLAKEPLLTKQREEERLKKEKEIAFEEKRRQEIDALKDKIESLKEKMALKMNSEEVKTLTLEVKEYALKVSTLSLSKKEKSELERLLKRYLHELEEKREENLLSLSDDDRKVLDNLYEIAAQRKERKQEIKKQIDEWRKILGTSSLDFSKAIEYNELMNLEKERLVKVEEGIVEIEEKIKELKKKA